MKLAAAPISWGVCEVPGWGAQVSIDRVLSDAVALGMHAMESGPPGFLPADPGEVRSLLGTRGMRLVGGFVTAILHDDSRRDAELDSVRRQAEWLAAGGGEVLVLAPASGETGYDARSVLDDRAWRSLFDGIAAVVTIADRYALTLAVHPHAGTAIATRADVERFLAGSSAGLCLDTGHLFIGGSDPADLVRRFPRRIRHVHLKDVDAAMAATLRSGGARYADAVKRGLYRTLGDGDVGIEGVLYELERSGYRGWYVLEQDVALDESQAAEASFPWIARSLEFVSARVA
jgi:inosose dehydratase